MACCDFVKRLELAFNYRMHKRGEIDKMQSIDLLILHWYRKSLSIQITISTSTSVCPSCSRYIHLLVRPRVRKLAPFPAVLSQIVNTLILFYMQRSKKTTGSIIWKFRGCRLGVAQFFVKKYGPCCLGTRCHRYK